jgi:hypothetical protein
MFDKIKESVTGSNADALGGYTKYLEGVEFPISKDDLLDHLQSSGATEAVIEHVRSLSRDRFSSADEVFASLFPS